MRLREWLPTMLVVALALAGPKLDPADSCDSTDGPQFKCWLDDQPE